MRVLVLIIFLISTTMTTSAQFSSFKSVQRVYTNNSEFNISTENEIYHLKNVHGDGSEWIIANENIGFTIKRAYTDINEWKICYTGKPTTTMYFKTVFKNSFDEWRTGDDPTHFFYIKSTSSADLFEWKCTTAKHGDFLIKAVYDKDSGEWTIDDSLEANDKIKFSMVFVVLISSMKN